MEYTAFYITSLLHPLYIFFIYFSSLLNISSIFWSLPLILFLRFWISFTTSSLNYFSSFKHWTTREVPHAIFIFFGCKILLLVGSSLFCWCFCPGSFDFGVLGRKGELESFYSAILSPTPHSVILEIRIGFLGASGQRSQLMPNGRWHPPPPSVDR